VLPSITSGLLGVSSQNFFQSTCRKAGLINWVQFLEGPPPKICEGKKSSKIFRDFWQLSTLIANISGTDSHIENRKSSLSTTTPPTLAERKTVNFGPQTKKLLRVMYIDHNVLFSEDYISALRGCCPLKFLHALQIDPGLLVHTPKRNGGPPKNFNRENLKFGLKFSVLPSITSGLLGVSSQNFFSRRAARRDW